MLPSNPTSTRRGFPGASKGSPSVSARCSSWAFFADKPADEVARELGLTPGNARVIRHRALMKLRECMKRATRAMNAPTCNAPIPFAALVEYWFGELGAERGGAHRRAPARLRPVQRAAGEPGKARRRDPRGVSQRRGVGGHFAGLPAGDETGRVALARIPRCPRRQRQLHDQCGRRRSREPVAGVARGASSRRPGALTSTAKAACPTFRSSRPQARCSSARPRPASRSRRPYRSDPPARGRRDRRARDRGLHIHAHAELRAGHLPWHHWHDGCPGWPHAALYSRLPNSTMQSPARCTAGLSGSRSACTDCPGMHSRDGIRRRAGLSCRVAATLYRLLGQTLRDEFHRNATISAPAAALHASPDHADRPRRLFMQAAAHGRPAAGPLAARVAGPPAVQRIDDDP